MCPMYDKSMHVYGCITACDILCIGSFAINGGFYGTGNNPILPRVSCNYIIQGINSCTHHYQWNTSSCYHGKEVGVLCQGRSM